MQCYIFSERKKEKNVLLSCKIQCVMYNPIFDSWERVKTSKIA